MVADKPTMTDPTKQTFQVSLKNKTHPRHYEYVGLPTLDRSMEQMSALQGASPEVMVQVIMMTWFDRDKLKEFYAKVQVGDVIGVGYHPYEVVTRPEEVPQSGDEVGLEVRDITPCFQDNCPLEKVREEAHPVPMNASYLTSNLYLGRCEILYRDEKPYGIPEEEKWDTEVITDKDEHGNEITYLKLKKAKPSSEEEKAPEEGSGSCS